MARTYTRNSMGRVSRVPWQQPWPYMVGALMFMIAGLLVWNVADTLSVSGWDLRPALGPVSAGLIGFGLIGGLVVAGVVWYQFRGRYDSESGLSGYIADRQAERAVERGLLSAGLVRKTTSETMLDVPGCDIHTVDRRTILKIERLPSVSDISAVAQAVNSSLRSGKYADYAVSNPHETADGLYYVFELSDVNEDLTFRPTWIYDLVPKNVYRLQLDRDTWWYYPTQPHAIISGLTGSKKTTTAMSLMAQALGAGADVYVLDYKAEMIGLQSILGADHVVQEPGEILVLLRKLVEQMTKRNEYIGREIARRGSMGLSGADLALRPVFIFCEELGALSEAFDAKEKKEFHGYLKQIAMLGRACLYNLVVLLQVATVESAPAGIKSNTNLKILLGKSTSEMVTQVFSNGYSDIVSNSPGDFKGYYFLNGQTTQPSIFHVPDLYSNGFNGLDTLAHLYDIGRDIPYQDIA